MQISHLYNCNISLSVVYTNKKVEEFIWLNALMTGTTGSNWKIILFMYFFYWGVLRYVSSFNVNACTYSQCY